MAPIASGMRVGKIRVDELVAIALIGIPTLTAPFVFATSLFLPPPERFAPVPDESIKGDAASAGSSRAGVGTAGCRTDRR